ncbi:hypothetical protein FJTKL_02184 [Diaporthe vaccinii]|uniref:Uncharacterized protein n=1 Tax=Diaporthe vaccinii TaxID=105482 RepID=A0ABR4DYI3_9PEZI
MCALRQLPVGDTRGTGDPPVAPFRNSVQVWSPWQMRTAIVRALRPRKKLAAVCKTELPGICWMRFVCQFSMGLG